MCFLKRVLPFTLTLLLGLAIGSLFNLFRAAPNPVAVAFRQSSSGAEYYTTSGCRSRRFGSGYGYSTYAPATILSQEKPAYTSEARRNQTEGEVWLRVTLGADGTVSNIETLKSLPDGLTEQARQAARQIKFTPASLNGKPVDEAKTITYNFNLD